MVVAHEVFDIIDFENPCYRAGCLDLLYDCLYEDVTSFLVHYSDLFIDLSVNISLGFIRVLH